ncbi:Mrp/NBP35 family ATP-binding protein (plasmid) [Coraliomargarita sp. W4R53]
MTDAAREAHAEAVRTAVSAVIDPELRQPIGDLEMVKEITVDGSVAHVAIVLTVAGCPAVERIASDVRTAAESVASIESVNLEVGVMTPTQRAALTERLRGGRPAREMPFSADSLTRIIAVTSGKGGVGKSSMTANLAVALADRGLSVGLIDADVHGFSIPALMGLTDADGVAPQPTRIDDLMLPPVAHGVKVISIGMFLRRGGDESPLGAVAWRGPMLHRTINQFLTDVFFGDLDILLLDMPPGTGDIAISVGQILPHAEVLVVTTPQSAAADIAARSGLLAKQTGQRVTGVIENMAAMVLPDGTKIDVFGSGGGQAVADTLSSESHPVPLLASVPLSPTLRQDADAGVPTVLAHPADPASVAIGTIADTIARSPRGLAGKSLPMRVR